MNDGNEILLYDHRRRPQCWSEIIQPGQCAVFLRDEQLRAAVGRDGRPRGANNATCVLFDNIDDAASLCRRMVAEHPRISCEVLDAGGRANLPLLTITREYAGGDDDMRGWLGRHRKSLIAILITASLPLFWFDWRHQGDLILTVLGINLIVASLRLLLWDFAAKTNERDRLARLEAHRRLERSTTREDATAQ
jgi:hypothetical protein